MKRRGTLLLILGSAAPLAAQSIRSYEYARPWRGERKLQVELDFAAGTLILGAPSSSHLYQWTLEYDADRFQPIGSYDAAAGKVRLGVESIKGGGIRVSQRNALPQRASLSFASGAELSLEVALGASEAELELGGYRLADFTLHSGASRATISFSKPNPASCGSATLTTGAGELTIESAGNSGCTRWKLEGGVGSVRLDLSGAWPADPQFDLSMAVGGVTLVAPKDLGVRVRMSGFLAGFNGKGFSKQGKTYTSVGYEKAARKVNVEVSSALGGVTVEWR